MLFHLLTCLAFFAPSTSQALQPTGYQADGPPTFAALGGLSSSAHALAVFDDVSGHGSALFIGGSFELAGTQEAHGIARWDGTAWSSVGTGVTGGDLTSVLSLVVHDDGSGPALYAGGRFTHAGGRPASNIARWNGTSWSALGSGVELADASLFGSLPAVEDLVSFDDGSGPALFVVGNFTSAGGVATRGIARWDGSTWSRPGLGLNGRAMALEVFDDGSGPALFVGGLFERAGGAPASGIARWDGASWSPLGSGVTYQGRNAGVWSLLIRDDGGGQALYIGGGFDTAGGVAASGVARWDGQSFSPLAGGIRLHPVLASGVVSLAEFDDGSGPALYAGGYFSAVNGLPARHLARWDGTSWSVPGLVQGLDPIHSEWVSALAVYDDGSGPKLHAAGAFVVVNGVRAQNIARFDGTSWSALE